ncbi:sigma-70 family RNA polymerase sigma factor [Brevibacterium casei]|uniref:sigma-70 family RNA polymerase sigma factor n=1 Tax=Brevibacterium casei TaxID=33889 RepID=UPI0021AECD48|nr:sigma-70 family RNA polymerase sigma factor [Brevibacterium casei]MCT1446654.1 sigma-70 family RNA polymerase sigma factor [Brevibacterium casei]
MTSHDPGAQGEAPPGQSIGSPPAADPCGRLLVEVAAGDRGAFEELFVSQSPVLMAVIVRIVMSRSLAEEVLQECFAEVWARARSFDPGRGTGRAWLVTMCRRRAIDCVRSVQASRDRDVADGLRQAATVDEEVEQTVISKAESDRTVSGLKLLPDDQSTPIVMAFYQGKTHAQISEELGVPLGTIKSRIRDGMKKLRRDLEASR